MSKEIDNLLKRIDKLISAPNNGWGVSLSVIRDLLVDLRYATLKATAANKEQKND